MARAEISVAASEWLVAATALTGDKVGSAEAKVDLAAVETPMQADSAVPLVDPVAADHTAVWAAGVDMVAVVMEAAATLARAVDLAIR